MNIIGLRPKAALSNPWSRNSDHETRSVVLAELHGGEAFPTTNLAGGAAELEGGTHRLLFYADVAARTGDLSRQYSGKVREFFIQYQDRLLYGSDIGIDVSDGGEGAPDELGKTLARVEKYCRVTWQYYTGEGTVEIKGKEVKCLNLPREGVQKFYDENTARIIPGL